MKNLYRIFERHPAVSTDSRNVVPGSIFFALRGDKFDGNRYAADALSKGAEYAVVDDPSVVRGDRYILVEDTLLTLQRLGTYHRRVLGIPVLAITGTNGKTTTKELAARVLSRRYRVGVTGGNLNNHIGVPLTLLAMKDGTEFGIVEMGASARGEINTLCNIVQPDFGLITNIGRAHLEGFGSAEGVRLGKGELFDYLATHHGLSFYLADDPVLSGMVEERPGLLAKRYTLHAADGIKSLLAGDYNRYNMAAAAALGEYFGITRREVEEAVESYVPDNHRSQRVDTGRNVVILDCYNANPSSMKAALENLVNEHSTRPKMAILGDMLELGEFATGEHAEIIRMAGEYGMDNIYLVGDNFAKAAAGSSLAVFPDSPALQTFLEENPLSGHLVLVKGSRGIALNNIIDSL